MTAYIARTAAGSALAITLLAAGTSAGAALLEVEQRTYGMDCAPCKYGVERSLGRLDGVESVQVSLERETTEIQLLPDNRITLAEIRRIIERNGFTPDEARIRVGGQVERIDSGWQLVVTDTTRLALDITHLDNAERERLKAAAGRMVELRGRVAAGDSAVLPLAVTAITAR